MDWGHSQSGGNRFYLASFNNASFVPVTLKCRSSNELGWSFKLWILEHPIKRGYVIILITFLWPTVYSLPLSKFILRLTHLLSLTGFAFFKWVFYFFLGSFCFLLSCKESYLFTSRKITVCEIHYVITLYALQHTIEISSSNKVFENGGSVS